MKHCLFLHLSLMTLAFLPRASASEGLVGAMPYSSQQHFEDIKSILSISISRPEMRTEIFSSGKYQATTTDTRISIFSGSYSGQIFQLSSISSIWLTYGLSAGTVQAHLSTGQFELSDASKDSHLLVGSVEIGSQLEVNLLKWLKPYAGVRLEAQGYKNASHMPDGDTQGETLGWVSLAGLRIPPLTEWPVGAFGEIRSFFPFRSEESTPTLLKNGFDLSFGLTLVI